MKKLMTMILAVFLMTSIGFSSRLYNQGGTTTDNVTNNATCRGPVSMTSFTLSLWTWNAGGTGGNSIGFDYFSTNASWFVKLAPQSNNGLVQITNTVGGGNIIVIANNTTGRGGSTIASQNWHNVIITRNGDTVTGFLDGVQAVSNNGFGTTDFGTAANTQSCWSVIGWGNGDNQFYEGRLARVSLWNLVLTQGEITAIANCSPVSQMRSANRYVFVPLHGFASPEPDFGLGRDNGTVTGTSNPNGDPFCGSLSGVI